MSTDRRNSGTGGDAAGARSEHRRKLLAWAEEEARQAGAEMTEFRPT